MNSEDTYPGRAGNGKSPERTIFREATAIRVTGATGLEAAVRVRLGEGRLVKAVLLIAHTQE